MLRTKRGFTLLEILIVMTVGSMIMGSMGSVFYQVLIVPPQERDQLVATNDLRLALDRIQYDGVQAINFTQQDPNYYGYFSWKDYPSESNHTVKYRYEDYKLIREETTYEGTTSIAIAFHIDKYGDIGFHYDGDRTVMVNMTVTLDTVMGKVISETDTRHIVMRAAQ